MKPLTILIAATVCSLFATPASATLVDTAANLDAADSGPVALVARDGGETSPGTVIYDSVVDTAALAGVAASAATIVDSEVFGRSAVDSIITSTELLGSDATEVLFFSPGESESDEGEILNIETLFTVGETEIYRGIDHLRDQIKKVLPAGKIKVKVKQQQFELHRCRPGQVRYADSTGALRPCPSYSGSSGSL